LLFLPFHSDPERSAMHAIPQQFGLTGAVLPSPATDAMDGGAEVAVPASAAAFGPPAVLLDKLGERMVFERAGTRLYDALILKYRAAQRVSADALPPARGVIAGGALLETPIETLERLRAEELDHFTLSCRAIVRLGGDPTAHAPDAEVTARTCSGFVRVLEDPGTTLAQCLNAMVAIELADNVGWELLARLSDEAGRSDLTREFLAALLQEEEHLSIVKGWLASVLLDTPNLSVV
jgi:hypothetical protein